MTRLHPRRTLVALFLLAAPTVVAAQPAPSHAAEPAIIPRPRTIERAAGHLALTPATRIVAGDTALTTVARQLADYVAEFTGAAPAVVRQSSGGAPSIHLALDPTLGAEAYQVHVTPDGARIAGGDAAGVFYGVQTLRQLLPATRDSTTPVLLPALRISDAPRFAWRGMHLDVSRHFFSLAQLERYVDHLARYKLNRFHLHLTDDQGWRLDIVRYPELTRQGAWRTLNGQDSTVLQMGAENPDFHHLPAEHFTGSGGERRYGGFYTQAEMRALVAYAAERHVTIVPEIDMPGHFMAAIAAYPELSCTGAAEWGTTFSVPLCPGKEEVYTFVENVLDEVASTFPGPWIHIGGDEVEKTTWRDHPGTRALMEREGLDSLNEVQGYFIRRVSSMLAARGKRMIGWDEIIEGGLAPGATVMFWRAWVPDAPVTAARAGHDVIMSPTSCCYFDYAETETTLPSLHAWEPVPAELTPAESRHILGVQANLWTEWIATPQQLEYMAFPRMLALADVAWMEPGARAWPDFAWRLAAHYPRLDALGVHYRVAPVPGLHARTVIVADTTIALPPPAPGIELRYTTDGTLPTRAARSHTEPLRVTGDVELRVRPYYPSGLGGPAQTIHIERQVPRPADTPASTTPGLRAAHFPVSVTRVDSIRGAPAGTVVVPDVTVPAAAHGDAFAVVFAGYVRAPSDGVYTFTLTSDDGSTLHIGERLVVDNDTPHGPRGVAGQVALRAGLHPIRLRFFEAGGGYTLKLEWAGPGVTAGVVPAAAFAH